MLRATAARFLSHPLSRKTINRFPQTHWRHPTINASRTFSLSPPSRAQTHYVRFGGSPGGGRLPDKTRLQVILGLGALASVYYVAHLEQVPETGRWRFMNVSAKFEDKFAKAAREEILQEHQHLVLPHNHPISRHARRVASRILASSNLGHLRGDSSTLQSTSPEPEGGAESPWDPDAQFRTTGELRNGNDREWDVVVVNDPKIVNAAVVPGLIVVYTGLLPVCQGEEGLSAVLSHEIGHVVARHSAERISSQTVTLILLSGLEIFGLDFGLGRILHTLVFQLPNSRVQELEADKIGMTLMSRACYNPQSAVELFKRMGQLDAKMGRVNLDFLNTHPSSNTRVQKLEELLPDAFAALSANPDCAAVRDRMEGFREVAFGAKSDDSESWT